MSKPGNANNAIAITTGEPAGIGPDICIMAAQQNAWPNPLVAIADPVLLEQRARQLELPLTLHEWRGQPRHLAAGELWVKAVKLTEPCQAGQLNPANAAYVVETLNQAVSGCQHGEFGAMVTAPLHKGVINDAGITLDGQPFSGHTEYLAEQTQTDQVVMMLAADGLRVALATTHLPLSEVPTAITATGLNDVIRVLHHDLVEKFGIPEPNILVCGLNPHAGEGGHLGREEIEVITPALETLRAAGIQLQGPLPADTLFTPKYLEQADAVLAMYHDQGLPVLKHMGFGNAVNITLGLPIIRTSVDHGTALDLAGTGQADPGSLAAAIHCAAQLMEAANG